MYDRRKLFELFVTTNVNRLTNETLEKVVALIEPEVYERIDEELVEIDRTHKLKRIM